MRRFFLMLSLFALAALVVAPAALAASTAPTLDISVECIRGTGDQAEVAEVSLTPSNTGGEGFESGEVTVGSGNSEFRQPQGVSDGETSTIPIGVTNNEITVDSPERFGQPEQTLTVDTPCAEESAPVAPTLDISVECIRGTGDQAEVAEVSLTPSNTGGEGFESGEVTVGSGNSEFRQPQGVSDGETSTIPIGVTNNEITVDSPERFGQPEQTLAVDTPCSSGETTTSEESTPATSEQYENEASSSSSSPSSSSSSSEETPASSSSSSSSYWSSSSYSPEEAASVVEESVVEAGGTSEQAEAASSAVAEGADAESVASAAAEAGAEEDITDTAYSTTEDIAAENTSSISVLPDTGGASLFILLGGTLLVGGAILARRIL